MHRSQPLEKRLLRALGFAFGRIPWEAIKADLSTPLGGMEKITTPFLQHFQRQLARETTLYLAQQEYLHPLNSTLPSAPDSTESGWLDKRLACRFTQHSLHVLRNLVTDASCWEAPRFPRADNENFGDILVEYLVVTATAPAPDLQNRLLEQPSALHNPLLAIAFPDRPNCASQDWEKWLSPQYHPLWICLQRTLGKRWVCAAESLRCETADTAHESRASNTASNVTAFLMACEKNHAQALSLFLLRALVEIVRRYPSPLDWYTRHSRARHKQREHQRQLSLTIPRLYEHFERWTTKAQQTRFIDEDYPAAQDWLREFENIVPTTALFSPFQAPSMIAESP